MSKIEEHIYLGNIGNAKSEGELRAHNIKHVLSLLSERFPTRYDGINYKSIVVRDRMETNLMQYFDNCYQFIREAQMRGENVLIHCRAGISRSATIVSFNTNLKLLTEFYFVGDCLSDEEATNIVQSSNPKSEIQKTNHSTKSIISTTTKVL